MRATIWTTTSLAALLTMPGTSLAQDQPSSAPEVGNAAASGDIVVTARRRAESLTSVPVAVTAIAGDTLADRGITRVDDLANATPAVRFTPSNQRRPVSQYEVRGIAAIESLIVQDPAVGIYVDEVYRARATGTNQSFYDIENVQVLYGPQGTLFGRNSSGGAVLISSNKPINKFEAEAEVSYGNYNAFTLYGMVNAPVNDRLQVRLAGQRQTRDGYGRNSINNSQLSNLNNYSLRGSVRWMPTDTVENLLTVSYFKANEASTLTNLYGVRNCGTFGSRPAATCNATFNAAIQAAFAAQKASGPYITQLSTGFENYSEGVLTISPDQFERSRNFSISNTTTIDLNETVSLKNIFGYNFVGLDTIGDFDGTPANIIQTWYGTTTRQYPEELQLRGDNDKFDWVVGGLYFFERGEDIQNSFSFGATRTKNPVIGVNKSYAAFAQGTYRFTDQLSLTAGARYTIDTRRAQYNNPTSQSGSAAPVCALPPSVVPVGGACNITLDKTYKQPTYTVSIDFKPTPDTLLYMAHRLGYRAGGFNPRLGAFVALRPFDPEKVRDAEFGAKGTVRFNNGGFARATVAVYKAWFENIQKTTAIQQPPGITPPTTTIVTNAANATVQGFEATVGVSPAPGIEFSGFLGYVDGEYKNWQFVGTACGSAVTCTLPPIPFATSKWTGGVSGSVTVLDTPAIGTVTARTDLSFRSHSFAEYSLPFTEPESRVGPQQNVNATLSWDNIGGTPISVDAWVRNLFEQVHVLGGNSIAGPLGVTVQAIGEPRMYGMTVKVKLGD